MRKKIYLFLILTSMCFTKSIFGCSIVYISPNAVSPGDTVLIKIIADFVHCGNYSQAGFIEPIGYDTLYYDDFEIINDTLAQVLITIPANLPYSEVEFFICNTNYWDNKHKTCLTIGSKTTVYKPNLCMVTVDSLNKNMVIWSPPSIENIDSVIVYKETSTINDFKPIETVKADKLYFIDTLSEPAQNSDRYKIEMKDKSGSETLMSDIHKTIHLTINAGLGGVWNLLWDNYEGFQYSSYKILRGTSDGNLIEIAERPTNTNSYSDLHPPVETLYYQIEVLSPSQCNIENLKSINSSYASTRSNMVNSDQSNYIDSKSERGVKIWPNPFDNKLYIRLEDMNEMAELSILTLEGKVVINELIDEFNTEISTASLNRGFYVIRLCNSTKIIIQKLIKR